MKILHTFLFVCAAGVSCSAEEDTAKYRLPTEVIPISYALKLQPFIPEGYFKGETYISLRVFSPVNAIYVHGSSLNVSKVEIVGDLEKVLFKLEEKYELIKLYYENGEKFLAGDYMVHFKYQGTLLHADQMGMVKGMYSYKNGTETLVITDFQPTHARRALPCFDEPAMKATFNVTIITPDSSWVALSNADELGHEETNEGVVYRFETTPVMSTDLLSFVVTKMDFIQNLYPAKHSFLRIRTYLPNAKEENQTFVLNFAAKSVDYFEKLTWMDYPMSKIDFIEYDKKFTATEYWGLTTFKRGLLNPSSEKYDTRQISIIIAHELTHYWFGNLVTNKWWSDIWLQEGFAQYLSHKVVDEILNTTNVEEYPLDYTIEVFKEDRDNQNVNPIVSNCTTPKEIMVQFNDITYVKAGSLIRLLDFLTGVEGFKKIIRRYFKEYSFKSANTEDFIRVVESVIPNRNLREFLETWLFQNRYPVITIVEDVEKKKYILKQESASSFKDIDTLSPYGYKWTIPIIYTTDIKKEPTVVWFKKDDEFITIPKGAESFIKLNYEFMGIYHTKYTPEMWQNLIDNVHMLSEVEQVQLSVEAENLFESGYINCDISLKLVARTIIDTNQYGVSPLSVLFTLKENLKFDQSAIALLRKFYFSIRAKSKLARKKEEEANNVIKKLIKRNAIFDKDENEVSKVETHTEKPHPKYIKCAKWIHENLSYLT